MVMCRRFIGLKGMHCDCKYYVTFDPYNFYSRLVLKCSVII